jgi:2-oxoisovalerate dehydrogenase E2 component (dihydrolipoyl transacylase)
MPDRVFAMPDLGEGLEEGEIVSWFVDEGDEVELNQPLVEVETAKATVEIPSPYGGTIARLHAVAGDSVPVGAPLVTFGVERGPTVPSGGSRGPAATPAVRRLARELGVDLSRVEGSGPGGRIIEDDVRRAAGSSEPVASAEPTSTAVTATRRAIARRLTEVAAIPQVTTFRTVDCTALETFRRGLKVSPLPVVVRALAEVCEGHPLMNSAWAGNEILLYQRVHAGIATDTERGLVVPVVRDVDARGIEEIASEIRRVARAARAGHLSPADVAGATISVSNTGSYGSEAGTPLLNPGNAVTLAIGVVAPRALVVDGEVVARPACTLSLTFDHRVLDGAAVGRALTDLVELLEDAERLGRLPR